MQGTCFMNHTSSSCFVPSQFKRIQGRKSIFLFLELFSMQSMIKNPILTESWLEVINIYVVAMDIISQLQEQVNSIASLAFNTFGTLQRDAPSVRLSPNYPEPPPHNPSDDSPNISEQPKLMAAALVKAAKQFDALVAALPLSEGGEEAQLKRITELQAENDVVGQELQRQLEAAEKELKLVQELFCQTTDNCLNLKKPD